MGARRSAACYGGGDPAVERVEERMVGAVPGSQAANQAAPEAPLETVDAPKPARAPGKLGLQILDFGVGDPPQIVLSAALSPGPAHRLPLQEEGRHALTFAVRRGAVEIPGALAASEDHHRCQRLTLAFCDEELTEPRRVREVVGSVIVLGHVGAEAIAGGCGLHHGGEGCDILPGPDRDALR